MLILVVHDSKPVKKIKVFFKPYALKMPASIALLILVSLLQVKHC